MKTDRRGDKEQRIVWEEYRPNNWTLRQRLLANTYTDQHKLHQPERRVDHDTMRCVADIHTMAKSRDIIGFAGVAMRPDGRVVLLACGNAYDDNIRASGALVRLQALLNEIMEE